MNPNRVRPLSNPCATFHSEWTASAVKQQRGKETEDGRRLLLLHCRVWVFHPRWCRAQIVRGRSWRNHRTSTLVWKMNRAWGPASLFVLLNCNTRCVCSKMKERSGRSWVRSLQYQSLSLSVISWRWHCSKQQRSGWPREVFHHRDGFVQCFY